MCPAHQSAFGIQLRDFREAAGLSQEDLARRSGLSARGISDLERGIRTMPRLETVRMLADGLGLSDDDRSKLMAARGQAKEVFAQPMRRAPDGIPRPPTSFIGRELEIQSILSSMESPETRFVTLVGPGGVGKTRLAIEIAHRQEVKLANSALFIDLSPVRRPELVVRAIADRLGVRGEGPMEIGDLLAVALQDRELLLVLDNLEQVLSAASEIAWLLSACPHIRILATSRIPLRIQAEHVMPVDPMTLPQDHDEKSLRESEAVSLFVARAQSADHRFALTAANAVEVATLVRRLQGMPLAIELAATRIRFWSVAELLERLQSQLPVLAGGARDGPDRHRTMRDTIAWSYNLMSVEEKAVFRTLSVFPDGCTLESAVAILGAARGFTEEESLLMAELLVDGSILRRRLGSDGRERYRMMPPIREYGLEQLHHAGEEMLARRTAHEAWCMPMARHIERGIAQSDAVARMALAGAEYQNIREHILWLIQHELIEEALDISSSLAPLRTLRGHIHECAQELQALLNHPLARAVKRPRMRAQIWLGIIFLLRADIPRALDTLQTGISLARELKDQRSILLATLASCAALRVAGSLDEAETCLKDAINGAVDLGDDFILARGLWNLGLIHESRGDRVRASQYLEEGLALNLEIGNLWDVAFCKLHLGTMDLRLGDLDKAEALFHEAHQLMVNLDDRRDLSNVYIKLADVAWRRKDVAVAEQQLKNALAAARAIGNMIDMAHSYLRLARIEFHKGDVTASQALTCNAIYWYERCGSMVDAMQCLDHVADMAIASGDFKCAAWCIGAVDHALAKHGISRPEQDEGEYRARVQNVMPVLGGDAWKTLHSRATTLSPHEVLTQAKAWLQCRISEIAANRDYGSFAQGPDTNDNK